MLSPLTSDREGAGRGSLARAAAAGHKALMPGVSTIEWFD